MIAIVGIHHRSYTHYTLYRSCLPIDGIAIVRSVSFLFVDDIEGNTSISVATKSGSTVSLQSFIRLHLSILLVLICRTSSRTFHYNLQMKLLYNLLPTQESETSRTVATVTVDTKLVGGATILTPPIIMKTVAMRMTSEVMRVISIRLLDTGILVAGIGKHLLSMTAATVSAIIKHLLLMSLTGSTIIDTSLNRTVVEAPLHHVTRIVAEAPPQNTLITEVLITHSSNVYRRNPTVEI